MLEILLSLSAEAILLFDMDGTILGANPAAEETFGFSRADLIGKPLSLLLPERYHAGHAALFRRFANEKTRLRRMGEFRPVFARRKNGSELPVALLLDGELRKNRCWWPSCTT